MGCAGGVPVAAHSTLHAEDPIHKKYRLGGILGEGSFGQVRLAKSKSTGADFAVKILEFGAAVSEDELLEVEAEAEAMRLLADNPHCVRLIETFSSPNRYYLIMEKCQGILMTCLSRRKQSSEDYMACVFREMLLGILHVHESNLVHCDIKPNNFLLGGPDGQTVKLADFGMTCKMPEKGYLTSHCGTAPYMSPEIVARKLYDFRTDVWSMGVTVYVLLYGDFPYVPKVFTPKAMKQLILIGNPAPDFISHSQDCMGLSACAENFVRKLLERDQMQRCTSRQALLLPFVLQQTNPPVGAADLTPSLRNASLRTSAEGLMRVQPQEMSNSGSDSTRSGTHGTISSSSEASVMRMVL
jgi:serine/threonine protein kinase